MRHARGGHVFSTPSGTAGGRGVEIVIDND